jgi:hypothetical protein
LLLLLAGFALCRAQGPTSIFPTELYSGDNVITIRLAKGIRKIATTSTSNVRVVSGTGNFSCDRQRDLQVFLATASEDAWLAVHVTDCDNRDYIDTLRIATKWEIDRNNYGEVDSGSTACREFQVRAIGGATIYLDSISVDDPELILRLPTRLPIRISPGTVFNYRVCVRANTLGFKKFPVVTWIRRTYPSAGNTTYAVADTGAVVVVRKRMEKPSTDTLRPPPEVEPEITDPTTFRTIAVPNAVIPKSGRLYLGSYDLLGLTAGYAVSDNFMLIAGGALPTPDDWGGIHGEMFGAYSIGAKGGVSLGGGLDVALGYQWGTSIYDQASTDAIDSKITVNAPYLALSYGDDDSRLSATVGYAFKHHSKPNLEFVQNAMITAFGGDYRIARHWKIAGEILSMESLGVVPIVATARYFTSNYALDFGIGYVGITTGDTEQPKIPLLPVVSGVFVF